MDASDRIRQLQGKVILRDFKVQLSRQPGVDISTCNGLENAKIRYVSYEYREQVRNGLATTCNTCTDSACVQAPYG